MPKFAGGTLPREFKSSPAKSVETIRRDMGDKLWLKNLTHSKLHHQMNYVYKSIGCEKNNRLRKNSMPSTQKESFLNLSPTNVEPQLVTNEEKCPVRIKKDQNPRNEKEMPHKRELLDSSDDFDTKRSVLPHMSKPSKSVAQLAVKNTKTNHSKGRTKVAARQRVSSIGEHASAELSDDNSEVGSEAQNVPVVSHLDTVPKRSAAAKRKKRSRNKDSNTDSDHSSEWETSIMVLMRSKATIKRQSADTKKKTIAVGSGQHLAAGKVSRHERIEPNGRSLSQTTFHGIFQPISPWVGEIESTSVIKSACIPTSRTHEDGCSQELRRRFCVMQADQEDAIETVKCSKKTVISVPRKFKETSAPGTPTCCTDGMVGIAPSSRLCAVASSVQTGTALAAPSLTVVFSSSNGFSMESWFKRKLMTDFMGGET
ncbi:unnamed protein product [Peronospora destructor]|uniref:Uncharacterized protein n=1 Tax=Peronospora destructor TaxID=86335 RepID=A0AAV0U6S8_9STRA|nr:unnamed protein product [Peronospora destructor]